jgi:hypothetical protein
VTAHSSFSVTVPIDDVDAIVVEDHLRILDDSGVRYRGPAEPRTVEEVWRFLIDVDWASVRDNLVAAGIGAGATGVAMAAKSGFQRLGRAVSASSRQLAAPSDGKIVIRDMRAGVHIEIDVKSADAEEPWDALAAESDDSVKWDAEKKLWVPRG